MHIIDFTIPYPADYGGVIDLFWKLPALQAQGVHIHLHCFNYGRGEQPELNKYCYRVNYYKRDTGIGNLFSKLPYIVVTRKNETLFTNLLKDNYPILMEGVHSTYLLHDERFANRKKFVRVHNVEYEYYKDLKISSSSFYKKIFYNRESKLLKSYEASIIPKATAFWSVVEKDAETYRNALGCTTIENLPLYLPNSWTVSSKEGKGSYCLYQGDLSVESNEKAAIWLLQNVFSKLTDVAFVIAGKNPSDRLKGITHNNPLCCLVANPAEAEMNDMVAKAHIHILPSYSNTGIKLKLLNALFNGRYCLVNNNTAAGSGVESLCQFAETAEDFVTKITELYVQPFTNAAIEERKKVLAALFSNEANAKQQVKWIWD